MTLRSRLFALCGVLLALAAGPARAEDAPAPTPGPVSVHAAKMKALQVRLLREEMRERLAKRREAEVRRRAAKRAARPGERARPPRESRETRLLAERLTPAPVAPPARAAAPTGATAFPPANVRVNDPTGENPGVGQSEQCIAALGDNVLITYNDGQGFVSGGNLQGYAYSIDGGQTFTDGGVPPRNLNWIWTSDPLVVVNEKTGEFFVCAMVDTGTTRNGIGIVKATFSGSNLVWGTPRLVVHDLNSNSFFDKPWLAVDTTTSALYVTYSRFTTGGNQIEVRRSTDGGNGWLGPTVLSDVVNENGRVQGSRVVARGGTAYAMWYSIGPVDVDYYKVRKSTNGGSSWSAAINAVTFYANYGAGAPGFNRGNAVNFAGMALNRSTQRNPGRLYLTWSESIDFYADDLGGAGAKSEVEPNEASTSATPFTPGQVVRGNLTNSSDFDWFAFSGTAGQTLIAFVDSCSTAIDGFLRVFCSDGNQRLALSAPGGGSASSGLIVWTLPATGTYYLRFASISGGGGYRIVTNYHTSIPSDRARDHRDVYVAYSDNGTTWNFPAVRVSGSPAGYDDWLPEIAVDGQGRAYTLWYDWRDSPPSQCGGVSSTYLAYSEDGGASWTQRGAVSDALTDWTAVNSNIAPNQGDYLGLYANGTDIWPAWADGRNTGTGPDVYTVRLPIATTPATASLVAATAEPGRVRVRWAASSDVTSATVYRVREGGAWEAVLATTPDGEGFVAYEDTAVEPGARYGYRLGVREAGGPEVIAGETWVTVPAALDLALLGARPNPAERDLFVAFALPRAGAARLDLIDVAGRIVRAREVGSLGAGRHTVNLGEGGPLPMGVYVLRLSMDGRAVTSRVSVVR
jgi:hypothetical protein